MTTQDVTTQDDSADVAPAPAPGSNRYALGQSVQIRVNADGEQNSPLANFRWSVSQLTVQGPLDENESVTVPVPEGGHLLRYLNKAGFPPHENDVAEFTADVQDGFGLARTVSLVPEDFTLPVSFTAKFTLDGQPVTAQEIVGKSGVVKAEYTISNDSTTPTEVTLNEGEENEQTLTVDAQTPMLMIAKTLLPQRFTGLELIGLGASGADGRGNNQVQWLGLPFKPLSADGVTSFGWTANVRDGQIPSMLIQVAPFYIPEGHGGEDGETIEEVVADSPVNLDPGVQQIQAGLARIAASFDMLGGGPDPLKELQNSLNQFFTQFGNDLQNLATQLDPNNPDSATNILPQAIEALNTLSGPLDTIYERWPEIVSSLETAAGLLNPITCRLLTEYLTVEQCLALKDTIQGVVDNSDRIQGNLDIIVPLLGTLTSVLTGLNDTIQSLSQSVSTIAKGLQETNVDLPALDAVLAAVVAELLASPFGQELTGGLDQLSTGISLIGDELTAFLAGVIVEIQTGVVPAVTSLQAGLAGLIEMGHQSPLVYGPKDVAELGAPEGTFLAGAYEFRVDAADSEHPNTVPRILLGVVLLVAAGAITLAMRNKRKDEAPQDESVMTS